MGQHHVITAIALTLTLLEQPTIATNPPTPERLAQVVPNTVTG